MFIYILGISFILKFLKSLDINLTSHTKYKLG